MFKIGTVKHATVKAAGEKVSAIVDWNASHDLTGIIQSDGSVPFAANQSIGNNNLTSVKDPINIQDADTKNARDAAITAHNNLATGVHGVGIGTVAKVSDIAVDANLSAAAQDAITKRHTQGTDTSLGAQTQDLNMNNFDINNATDINAQTVYLGGTSKKAIDTTASSIEYYVDLTLGNDATGTGSSAAPFKTVQKAVDSLPRTLTLDCYVDISNGTCSEAINTSGISTMGSKILTFRAKNTAGVTLYDNGTATGGTANTLQDTGKAWTVNAFAGGKVWVWGGTGAPEAATIASNTSNTITIVDPWTAPDATSYYVICSSVVFNSGAGCPFTLYGLNVNVYGFQFADSTTYSLHLTGVYANINYNYFDSVRAVDVRVLAFVLFYYNYMSIANASECIIEVYSSFVARFDAFVAESAGVGIGIQAYRDAYILMGTAASNRDYFKDLATGIQLQTIAQGEQITTQTFSGCTNDYIFSDYSIKSINASGANCGFGTSSPTAYADINSDILRLRINKTPASAAAAGNKGDICWDASYIYFCVATNTWKRAAITTW